MKNFDKVMVCDRCFKASCWYGLFMCDDSDIAGLKIVTVGDLRALGREHESYWSDEALLEHTGSISRNFRV